MWFVNSTVDKVKILEGLTIEIKATLNAMFKQWDENEFR